MIVLEQAARSLLVAMGRTEAADAEKFNLTKLTAYLNGIDDRIGDGDLKEPTEPQHKTLFASVRNALQENASIAVTPDTTISIGQPSDEQVKEFDDAHDRPAPEVGPAPEENGKPAKRKRKKAVRVEKNGTAKKKKKENVVKVAKSKVKRNVGTKDRLDKFGSRIGSSNAIVNKVLGKRPLSFSQIVEKSGLSPKQVRYKHLYELENKGFVVKTDEGWAKAGK